jgi:hypothetical protein
VEGLDVGPVLLAGWECLFSYSSHITRSVMNDGQRAVQAQGLARFLERHVRLLP